MRYRNIIVFLIVLYSCKLSGQDSLNYGSILQIRTNFGFSVPRVSLLTGDVTDYLVSFDDHSNYWEMASVSYFPYKSVGLNVRIRANSSSKLINSNKKFTTAMQAEYGDNYYISTIDPGNIGLSIQPQVGLVYRIENKRFLFYPSIAMGFTFIDTEYQTVYLKRKNSNEELSVIYRNTKPVNSFFTFSGSALFGYKLSKRFFLNLDLTICSFKTDILYEKTTTNLNTNTAVRQRYEPKNSSLSLSLGLGFTYALYKKNRMSGHR